MPENPQAHDDAHEEWHDRSRSIGWQLRFAYFSFASIVRELADRTINWRFGEAFIPAAIMATGMTMGSLILYGTMIPGIVGGIIFTICVFVTMFCPNDDSLLPALGRMALYRKKLLATPSWKCPGCKRRFKLRPNAIAPNLCSQCVQLEAQRRATKPPTPPIVCPPLAPKIVTPIATPSVHQDAVAKKWPRRRIAIASFGGIIFICCAVPVFLGGRPSINPVVSLANARLQSKVNEVIKNDYRDNGIDASAYYGSTLNTSVIVFDLQSVSSGNSMADVFRVFLDVAEKLSDEQCETVELSYRGTTKFTIEGEYFRRLGRDRRSENPMYMVRTFPEHLKTITGARAYPEWTGGLIGVLGKQMEDFNDFHKRWYLNDGR